MYNEFYCLFQIVFITGKIDLQELLLLKSKCGVFRQNCEQTSIFSECIQKEREFVLKIHIILINNL